MDEFPKALYHATDPTSPRVVQSTEEQERYVAEGWTVTPDGSAVAAPVPEAATDPTPETDATFARDLAANEAAADDLAETTAKKPPPAKKK
jgi:hypothetical protein